ncbi:MAG TPA: extracellular solute-binding protein [Candidatus Binatia bacterium]|jgi:iron(III) transport system substrate-binding protein|nr:extracellular solute-binding protein [Candidatus Binatia bacterium]
MRNCFLAVTGFFIIFLLAEIARSAAPEEWNAILAKARQEGQVVLLTSVDRTEFRQAATSAFEKRFGIKAEFRVLMSSEATAVASRECAARRQSADAMLGGNSEVLALKPRGCLEPLKPRLILPEVLDPKNWKGGFLKWTDPESQYILQTVEYVSGSVFVNTDRVKPADVTSAKDLLKPEYKGKMVSHEPRRSGSGEGKAAYYLTVLGEDYVRALYLGQKITFSRNHAQLLDWIVRGVHWIGLGLEDERVDLFRREGFPIAAVTQNDAPGYLSGDSSMIKLLKEAPHPNAATVLVNWLASKEGQEIFTRFAGRPSRRTDVNVKVPEWLYPRAGYNYVDSMDYEYYSKKRPEVVKSLVQLLGR